MLAGTMQRRGGPSSSVLKHNTAGDHISNIFSLIVSFFCCISTLPATSPWVRTAESLLEPSKRLGASGTTALLGSASLPPCPATAQRCCSLTCPQDTPKRPQSCGLGQLQPPRPQQHPDTAASSP